MVRYKQTVIGIAWSVIRPFLIMVVFTIIFGKLAKLPTDGNVPYPILVFTALLPWQFFANSLHESSNSLIANASMISKVYLPRVIIPATSILVGLLDFFISFILLVLIMLFYQFIPSWKIIFIIPLLCIATLTTLGFGLFISALNVKFRDFRYVVPFIIQFGLYISPVGFSSSIVPAKWRLFYSVNPMVGVIDGFRWAILGTDTSLYWPGFVISISFTLGLFLLGLQYFRKTEKTFADVI